MLIVYALPSLVLISDAMSCGGLTLMLLVPHPVIRRLSMQGEFVSTWLKPSTWPTSCASVHCDAICATTAPGFPEGKAAHPLLGGTVERTKYTVISLAPTKFRLL